MVFSREKGTFKTIAGGVFRVLKPLILVIGIIITSQVSYGQNSLTCGNTTISESGFQFTLQDTVKSMLKDSLEVRKILPSDLSSLGHAYADFNNNGVNDLVILLKKDTIQLWDNVDGLHTTIDITSEPARDHKTLLSVGQWNGSQPSIFYAHYNEQELYRVKPGSNPKQVASLGNGANAVSGIADIDGDTANELVFVDASQELRYIDDNQSVNTTGVTISSNNGIGVGNPTDFNGNGKASIPVVFGGNEIKLVGPSGTRATVLTGNTIEAKKAPIAAANADCDTASEIVFLKGDAPDKDNLFYIDDVRKNNTVKIIQNIKGNKVKAEDEIGVIDLGQGLSSRNAGLTTYDTLNLTATKSYTVPSGDETYTQNGTYMDTIPNSGGGDSILTINLKVTEHCSYYASQVVSYQQGTYKNGDTIASFRSNPQKALGAPAKHKFFSTGFQNSMQKKPYIILGFDEMMTGKLTVYEYKNNPLETADIYISQDNKNWKYVGEADNLKHPNTDLHPTTFNLDYTTYKYVRIVNTTDTALWNGKGDGYDVSGVCAEQKAANDYTQPACNYYGSKIMNVNQGTYKNGDTISASRSNPQDALGTPNDNDFFSLGFQNNMQAKPYLVIGFDSMMTGKLSIYEVDNNPIETADIYVSQDTSNWTYVGEAHNLNQPQGNLHPTTFELEYLAYQYVKIVNTTDASKWGPLGDGYDVAGICAEEKAPAYIPASCGFYANQVIGNKQGQRKNGNDVSPNRSNPGNALGAPTTNDPYSLGFQDSLNVTPYLTLGFDEMMTGKLTIYEVNNKPLETADIYVSQSQSNWTYVGEAHNLFKPDTNLHPTTFNLDSLKYQYVKIVNTTDVNDCPKGTEDAFDVAGICAEQKAPTGVNPTCKVYGSSVVNYAQGKELYLDSVPSSRSNPQDALGQPDAQNFFSLGVDTNVSKTPYTTLSFDTVVTGDLTIHEVTYNTSNYHDENVDVYVSKYQANWVHVGQAGNKNNPLSDVHPTTFNLDSLDYKYVKLVEATDISNLNENSDGFDLAGICASEIAPVNPAPSCNTYGTSIKAAYQGKQHNLNPVASNRSNTQNALGQPDPQSFYSLGLDTNVSQKPFLTIGFDNPMIGELTIHEVTWTSTNYPEEKAKVYVSPDQNNWTYVGVANNKNNPSGDIHTNTFQLDSIVYKYVKIVDVSNPSAFTADPDADGFDVTAICAESTITNSAMAEPQNVGFTIYPNPVSSGKAVKVKTNATYVDENQVRLYNAKGKHLNQINIRQDGTGFSIQTNGLGKGIYMLRIQQDNDVVNKRFVIH